MEHAFTVKVTRRRRYVMRPVMARASRDASLLLGLSAKAKVVDTLLSPIMSIPRNAVGFLETPSLSIFPSYRQYAVLGTDPVLVNFIIRKSPGL